MEKWKSIKGYKGLYEVSNKGRVRSLPRIVIRSNGISQTIRERILKCKPFGKHKYAQVNLSDTSKGRGESVFVHVLVATAFIPKPDEADRVCHKDDVGYNNNSTNLYWGTASTNGKDAYKNGKHNSRVTTKGVDIYNAVQDKKVIKVLKLKSQKLCIKDIATKVGLAYCTVHKICNFKGRFKRFELWS